METNLLATMFGSFKDHNSEEILFIPTQISIEIR